MDKRRNPSHAYAMRSFHKLVSFRLGALVAIASWAGSAGAAQAAEATSDGLAFGAVLVAGGLLGQGLLQAVSWQRSKEGLFLKLALVFAGWALWVLHLVGVAPQLLSPGAYSWSAAVAGGLCAWLALDLMATAQHSPWLTRYMLPSLALYGAALLVSWLNGRQMAFGVTQLAAVYLFGLIAVSAWRDDRTHGDAASRWLALGMAPLALSCALLAFAGASSGGVLMGLWLLTVVWAGLALCLVMTEREARQQHGKLLEAERAVAEATVSLEAHKSRERELELKMTEREVDLRNSQIMVRDMSHHDALTGLPSRRLFADRFSVAAARARREGRNFSLILVDIDRLSQVNQKRGHLVGDGLLKVVARKLDEVLRSSDTLARMGGDEFAMLLPNTTERAALEVVCRKILDAMQGELLCAGVRLQASVSVGAVLFGRDGSNLDDLYEAATRCLRQAKEEGRNTYRITV